MIRQHDINYQNFGSDLNLSFLVVNQLVIKGDINKSPMVRGDLQSQVYLLLGQISLGPIVSTFSYDFQLGPYDFHQILKHGYLNLLLSLSYTSK